MGRRPEKLLEIACVPHRFGEASFEVPDRISRDMVSSECECVEGFGLPHRFMRKMLFQNRSVLPMVCQQDKPVLLTGDCFSASVMQCALTLTNRLPTMTVWIDGHWDAHTWDTTTSGFIGGMMYRVLMQQELRWLTTNLSGAGNYAPPKNTYHWVQDSPSPCEHISDLAGSKNPPDIMEDERVHVHIDLDAIRGFQDPNHPIETAISPDVVHGFLMNNKKNIIAVSMSAHNHVNEIHLQDFMEKVCRIK